MNISKEVMNVNILSSDPFVATYENIISDWECQHFIKISRDSLKRSSVNNDKGGFFSNERTSSNTWIKHDHDQITKNVGERIAKIVGMPLENAESFQVIYYGESQEYKQHYDSWVHNGSEKTLRCMKWGGARMKTALCYLNDVPKGGSTKMTKLNITIPPIKRSMLVFQNTVSEDNHDRHELSEHAEQPVEEGEKFAFNLWFRECNSKILYKDFNPGYYQKTQKDKSNNNLLDSNKTLKSTNLLPETLQIGDFIPFIKINGLNMSRDIHNFCNEKPFIFITTQKVSNENWYNLLKNLSINFNVILLFQEGEILEIVPNVLYTQDRQLSNILSINDKFTVYITCPNRRIITIMYSNELKEMEKLNIEDYQPKHTHVPYLLIENALDQVLLNKVIDFYYQKKKEGKLISHQHNTKDRLHVHPDEILQKELDHKISRSVLPELRKVFYFDTQYRETYKICSYDAKTSGRFHPHRDTPSPYQYRKYAMSLFLNDDYKGGQFSLPEYGIKIKPKANTAFIFPGISTHQVLPVTKGSRMTIITFFINETNKPQYEMKAHYYKDKDIVESDIYPF